VYFKIRMCSILHDLIFIQISALVKYYSAGAAAAAVAFSPHPKLEASITDKKSCSLHRLLYFVLNLIGTKYSSTAQDYLSTLRSGRGQLTPGLWRQHYSSVHGRT
jgi:hypothetical protein